MSNTPLIVINVDGGVIQDIIADTAVEVIVLDFDTDGIEDEKLHGTGAEQALVSRWQVPADPVQIADVLATYAINPQSPDQDVELPTGREEDT